MVRGEMLQLRQTIPDPDVLLALEPEELAAKLLFLIRNRSNLDGRYHAGNLENELWHDVPGQPPYRAEGRLRSVSRWPKLLLGLRRRGSRFQIPG